MNSGRGEYRVIPPGSLHVDKRYQRGERFSTARKMAENWDWVACSTITVSKRNGAMYVVDGQHRVVAASIAKVDGVPSIVFENLALREEARCYRRVNGDRAPVHPVDMYRAGLVAEDPLHEETQKTLAKYGFKVANKGTSTSHIIVRCPTTLLRLQGSAELDDVLGYLSEAWPKHELLSKAAFLMGFAKFLRKWREVQENHNILISCMKKNDAQALYSKARALIMYAGSDSEISALVTVFTDMWNKGRRTAKIKD